MVLILVEMAEDARKATEDPNNLENPSMVAEKP